MRIKSRDIPCTLISTNQYSSKVSSQWRGSTEEDPDWGIRDIPLVAFGSGKRVPVGNRLGESDRDRRRSKFRKEYTKFGTEPVGLQGSEVIQYSTSTWYRRWYDIYKTELFEHYIAYLPCIHTKTVYKPTESYYYGGYYHWRWYNQDLRNMSTYTRGVWYPGLYGNTPKVVESHIVSEARFREAANYALLHLLAGKPQRPMNVALAVCELKDMPHTIRQLASFSKWCWRACKGQVVGKGSNRLIRLLDNIRKTGLKTNLRTLAQAYLWESFGVEPTVTDVKHFMRDVGNERLHVKGAKPRDRLVTGLTYKAYFNARDYELDTHGRPTGWPELNKTSVTEYTEFKYREINTAGNCQYNWKVVTEEYRGCVFAKLIPEGAQFQRYFPTDFNWGNPIFRTAWELIPFSFVVDWFADVGKAVQRLDDLTWVSWARLAWGEPWISYTKTRKEWYPEITYIHSVKLGDVRPRQPHQSGWGNAQYTCTKSLTQLGRWYPGKETKYYRRDKASELGVSYWALYRGLIPAQKVTFKRYQLTTGMALVVSLSKMFR